MSDVLKAWAFSLSNEDTTPPTGKVVSEPNGGMARLGINSRAHPEAVRDGFYTMGLEAALDYAFDLFKYDYWSMVLGYSMEEQLIASKVTDLAFNCSPRLAIKLVQRAINTLRGNQAIKPDGICGPQTIAAVNTYLDDVEALYAGIIEQGTSFYEELHTHDPVKFPLHLEEEWLERLNKRPPV